MAMSNICLGPQINTQMKSLIFVSSEIELAILTILICSPVPQ